MYTSQIHQCQDCQSLKHLLNLIDKSLYKRISSKWRNVQFNTEEYFNSTIYKDLIRYRRIIEKRLFNPQYPSTSITDQDIIGRINLIINR